MTRLLAASLALFILAPVRAAEPDWAASSRLPETLAKPIADDPMAVTVHRLSNGLTVYLSPNRQTPRVTAHIGVRAGGAQDPRDSTGMAHYLEHMLFKGSRRLGTLDYEKEKVHLDRIQGLYETLFPETDPAKRKAIYAEIDKENQAVSKYAVPNELDKLYKSFGFTGLNAYTSNERTVYVCDMPKNRLETWARLESDRFAHPVFRLFQTEIETVYEELNRSLDNPIRIVWKAMYETLYPGHPYEVPIIGTVEHLKNPSLAKMYAFYDRHYVPNNMAIALSGDFEREDVLPLLERHFGAWKPKALPADPHPPIAPITEPKRVEVRYEAEELALIAWPTVPVNHPDEDALTVMGLVVSNGEAGLVDLRLNQAQAVKSAGTFQDFNNEAGTYVAYVLPKDGQTIEQAQGLLLEALEALKKGDFSEDDLKAIVLNFEISEKYKRESNDGRVSAMMSAFAEYDEWSRRYAQLERLRRVTKADVVRVAEKYLDKGRVEVYRRKGKPEIPQVAKPEFTKVEIAPGRQSAYFEEILELPVKPIEPRWVTKGVDYRERRTPFGKLYSTINPMNDLFALSYQVERGMRHDRDLCAATELWDKAGAGELTAEALKTRLYGLGIKMSAWCAERASGWSLSGPERNLEAGLELLRARFRSPHVAPGTLEKLVAIWIGQHKDNKVEVGAIGNALAQWAERGAESGVLLEHSDSELKALKEEDLKARLADFLAWEGRATYVGTRDADAVASLLKEKGVTYKAAPARPPVRYVKAEKPRIIFVHRDMAQAQVGVFAPDGVVDPERGVENTFYSNYMGGGMSSVIFQEVREARALAYSAWGGYRAGGALGDENRVLGRLGSQADKAVEAVALLIKLLREPPPSEPRFKEAQESILQSYRTDPLTFREVPGALIAWEDLGYRKDPRPKRFKQTRRYSLDALMRFAERFKEKVFTVHVLGSRERVDMKGLAGLGTLEEKTVDDLFPY